jgi:hypothetical protein
MHDRVDRMGTEGFLQGFRVGQISGHKRTVCDNLSVTCLEVVVNNRLITTAFQLLDDMAPDVSSPSGDKNGRNMRGLSREVGWMPRLPAGGQGRGGRKRTPELESKPTL